MRVVATAGHVDHGKSSLVLALTGTDPDRWSEEKRRGLTIDLGFAFTTLPSGMSIGFVDVPGHVRFLKNMLAGVGAVHTAVLVVAATERWMPQTEEHLRILELLGIAHGFTVITMADLVDPDALELAEVDVVEHLAGTFLAQAPVITCDSISGRGLGDVADALDEILTESPPPADLGRPRLWVDRVFSAKGAGTVVTGTMTGGCLGVGDEVLVYPGGRAGRVRGIQSGHAEAERADAGARVAINLAGLERGVIARGHAVVAPDQWSVTDTVDAAVIELDGRSIKRSDRVKAYVGSGEHDATARPLEGGFTRVRLPHALPLAPGDRFVLRDSGAGVTLGAVKVLDVAPPPTSAGALERLQLPPIERVLTTAPVIEVAELARRTGLSEAHLIQMVDDLAIKGRVLRVGSSVAAVAAVAHIRSAAIAAVDDLHRRDPLAPGVELGQLAMTVGLDPTLIAQLLGDAPDLSVTDGRVTRRGREITALDDPDARKFLEALEGSPFSPPSPAEIGTPMSVVRALLRAGAVVETEGVYFSQAAYVDAARLVTAAMTEGGELTVGEIRDILGSSRKHVLPLLSRMDREGITRRNGDTRSLGRRAPDAR